jgi:hypothetical protein
LTHKRFPGLKAEFLKVYGFNNKQVSDRDMHEFIQDYLSNPVVIKTPMKVKTEPPPSYEKATSPFASEKPPPFSLESSIDTGSSPITIPVIKSKRKGLNGEELFALYKEETGENPKKGTAKKDVAALLKAKFPKKYGGLDNFDMHGFGVGSAYGGNEDYPHHAPLGKVCISPHKLFYENTLVVLNHEGKHITGFKNKKVSDSLAALLLKVLKKEQLTKHDYSLPLGERELFDSLIHLANLHKTVETNGFAPMKKRLELIEGEIDAGNTNHELIAEAHDILHKLALAKVITHPSAKKHLAYLKSL